MEKANILKSLERTTENEGKWQPLENGQKEDIGNWLNGKYYGTAWGVTAAFLKENPQLNILLDSTDVVKNLTQDDARMIWLATVGKTMRYEEMPSQSIADFIFDWCVQRPAACLWFLKNKIFPELGQRKGDAPGFNDQLIAEIQTADEDILYMKMKYWRLYHCRWTNTYVKYRLGVFNRIVKFDDFPDTKEVKDLELNFREQFKRKGKVFYVPRNRQIYN